MPYVTQAKLEAIVKYLSEKTESVGVDQYPDHEWRTHSFKFHSERGLHHLRIGDTFIAANGIAEITRCLDRWRVVEILLRDPNRGLVVTHRGPEVFEVR